MEFQELQHLYLRAGFGASYEEINSLEQKGRNEIIENLFHATENFEPLKIDLSEFENYISLSPKETKKTYSEEKLMDFRKKSRQKVKELNIAWIDRLNNSSAILREKMTLFWANVFVCKDNNVWHIQHFNNTLRENALGNFGDFVKAIAREASMSKYLNNKQNIKESPNENFARELMELFTLGIDQYTEEDIKESARTFTGWAFKKDGSFRLKKKKHDYGMKTFMGKSGYFDGDDIIDIILEQKQCARFICTKVYRYFVNPTIDPQHLNEITELFYQDYDINKLMHHIFSSNWFYHKENRGVKIKSPIELLLGIQKAIPFEFTKNKQSFYLQKMMGQILLNPPNVAGWKGDKHWIDSNTLMFRLKLPSLLLSKAQISLKEKGEPEDSFEDYYKTPKKKRFLQTTVYWESFEKNYGRNNSDELKKTLIISPISQETDNFLSKLSIKNTREYAVQLMSLPEYQLC